MLEELEALRPEEDGGRRSEHHRKSNFALDCALFPEITSDQAVLHQIETRSEILVRELGHKYENVEDIAHEATAIFIEKVASGFGAEGGGSEVMGSSSKNKYSKGGKEHAVVNDSGKVGGTGSEGEGSMEIQRGVEFEKIRGLEEKDSMEISSGQGSSKAVIESQNVGSVDSNKEVDGPKTCDEGSFIGSIALQDYWEAATIAFLFTIAEWLESRATHQAVAVLSSLVDVVPQRAVLAETGEELNADKVELNTLLSVKTGEMVPIDGIVVEGECEVDEKTLTGEPFPVAKQKD
nr:putative inactive cadmium/zinc-transporting ATPase HMA3 [Ipomoea batatas]